jgi:hypothetical protein
MSFSKKKLQPRKGLQLLYLIVNCQFSTVNSIKPEVYLHEEDVASMLCATI